MLRLSSSIHITDRPARQAHAQRVKQKACWSLRRNPSINLKRRELRTSGSGCGSQTPTRPNRFNTGKQYNCSTAPSNLQQYGDFATEIDIGGGVVAAALGWSNRWWTRWTIIYKMSGRPRFMSSVSHTYQGSSSSIPIFHPPSCSALLASPLYPYFRSRWLKSPTTSKAAGTKRHGRRTLPTVTRAALCL